MGGSEGVPAPGASVTAPMNASGLMFVAVKKICDQDRHRGELGARQLQCPLVGRSRYSNDLCAHASTKLRYPDQELARSRLLYSCVRNGLHSEPNFYTGSE